MPHRKRRTKVIRARVSEELKRDVQAIAFMRPPDGVDESDIVREALEAYRSRPDMKRIIEEGRRRMAEAEAKRRASEEGGANGESKDAAEG